MQASTSMLTVNINIWNLLPETVAETPSVAVLKRLLDTDDFAPFCVF